MKSFYSCTDSGCTALVSQRMQHVLNAEMADRLGGTISFYVGEDNEFLARQYNLKARLAHAPKVDGIVFFRLQQFNYGKRFDTGFLREILAKGYETHFARENLSVRSVAELDTLYPTLYTFGFLNGGDGGPDAYRRLTARIR